jgi:hypothetical protein
MTEVIRARARYTGSTSEGGFFENNSFHNIKIKQDGLAIVIIVEGDETKKSKTWYNTLGDFFDVWNIYCVLNVIRK